MFEGEFWRQYVASIDSEFAYHFGRNLNAFEDALSGGPGWPGKCTLRFANIDSVKSIDEGRFYLSLQKIVRDHNLWKVFYEWDQTDPGSNACLTLVYTPPQTKSTNMK